MGDTRKIIGTGETVFDILFRNGQPEAAVHGGSSFNSIISVGRAGVPCSFVGYAGADTVGRQTVSFMQANGVGTECFQTRQGEKSTISLAFLAEGGDATYSFYGEPLHAEGCTALPDMARGDILLFGSYYAVCAATRPAVAALLERAGKAGAIAYYDLNYRPNHRGELPQLMPAILQNIRQSTIVRGSTDDFEVVFGSRLARDIYNMYVGRHCRYLICTAGAENIVVCTPTAFHEFQAPPVSSVVSTVGAGDSFNAGLACALIWEGIMADDLPALGRDAWQRLVATACQFAAETCQSKENYINPRKPH